MRNIFIKTKFYCVLLIAMLILATLTGAWPEQTQGAVALSDIQNHWARNSIQDMADQGRIKGYQDGTFQPERLITRAEFAHLIVVSLALTETNGKGFDDTAGHWAEKSIKTASDHGIIAGYNENSFGPDDSITREQAAVILVKALGITSDTGQDFVDNGAVSYWALASVKGVSAYGIISGYPDGSFKPKANVTRAQAAVILQRSIALIGKIPVEPKEAAVSAPVVLSMLPVSAYASGGGGGGGAAVTDSAKSYTLTLEASPVNGGSVSGEGRYKEGDIVTAGATAHSGYTLKNWTVNGTQVSTSSTFKFYMPASDTVITANFVPTYTLTLQASPVGGGTVSNNSGTGPYPAGTAVSVTASPSSGYAFKNWTVNSTEVSTSASYTYTMPASDTVITANFVPTYTLTLQASPVGGGTVSNNSGTGPYPAGTAVSVTASPSSGYAFKNWTVNSTEVSTAANYTYIMPASNAVLVANFAPTYTLTLQASPSGSGSVSGAGTYEAGTEVSITAEAAEGYAFENWTLDNGTVVSTSADDTYSMPAANTTLIANFKEDEVEPEEYALTLQANPDGGGTVSGDGTYEAGTEVSITAEATEGYTFEKWTLEDGTEVSAGASYTYTMPAANTTLIANFKEAEVEPEEYALTLQANPSEGGTVSGAGEYEEGTSVSVTAEAAEGYTFSSWTSDSQEVSPDADYEFSMPAGDIELVANFTPEEPSE